MGVLTWACAGLTARADVILTAEGANAALKVMGRLSQQVESGSPESANSLFQLGVEAEMLTSLINDEIVAHGALNKSMIDLATTRAKEFGVAIAYNGKKRKFFYDGAAFRLYAEEHSSGEHVAAAKFAVLEKQFYLSTGSEADPLLEGVEACKRFLADYPKFELNAEVNMFVAIDYRDLFRLYREQGDARNRSKYEKLARQQFQLIVDSYPQSEQAEISRRLLSRFEQELQASQK